MDDVLASTLACANANASVNYSGYVPQRSCKLPIAPMGKWLTRLPQLLLAQLRPTLRSTKHFGQLNSWYMPQSPEISRRPMGKCLVDMSISILIFNDVGAASIYQPGVCATAPETSKVPIAPMGIPADLPKSTLIFQFGSIWFYQGYVRASRACKRPIAPMGFSHVLRLCLQGGGVYIYYSGTVSFSSCTITGNTAYDYVRAHAQKFPSPRWANC